MKREYRPVGLVRDSTWTPGYIFFDTPLLFETQTAGEDTDRTATGTAALRSKFYCLLRTFFASQRGATKTWIGLVRKAGLLPSMKCPNHASANAVNRPARR